MIFRTFSDKDKVQYGGFGSNDYKGDGDEIILSNVGEKLDPNWDYPWKQEARNVAFMNSTCMKKKLDLYALPLDCNPYYFLGKESTISGLNDTVKTMYNILS